MKDKKKPEITVQDVGRPQVLRPRDKRPPAVRTSDRDEIVEAWLDGREPWIAGEP